MVSSQIWEFIQTLWIKFLFKSVSMKTIKFYLNFYHFNWWREMKYFDIVTVTVSKPSSWANMLPKMNKCKNRSSNLSANEGSGIKFDRVNLIRVAQLLIFFNIWLHFAKWSHHELLFYLRWSCIYFSLDYILWSSTLHR